LASNRLLPATLETRNSRLSAQNYFYEVWPSRLDEHRVGNRRPTGPALTTSLLLAPLSLAAGNFSGESVLIIASDGPPFYQARYCTLGVNDAALLFALALIL